MANAQTDGASGAANPLTEEFGKYVQELLDEYHVPGISVAVIDGDKTFTQGYGHATLPDTKATPETVWFCGSTSKSFTAALFAQLIDTKEYPQLEKGWKTRMSSLIRDDFVLQDEYATEHTTLEDAAMHRTGFGSHEFALMEAKDGRKSTTRDHVRAMRHLQMAHDFRDTFEYSNFMYMALSHAAEAVTGRDLGDVLREKIWKPLGMDSTYFSEEELDNIAQHVATSYRWDDKAKTFGTAPRDIMKMASGAGAVVSSVTDYAKWIRCLLEEGDLFSKETHKDIRRPGIVCRPPSNEHQDIVTYGLAWNRKIYRGQLIYGHNGGCSQGAETYWIPGLKLGFVSMANTTISSNLVGMVLFNKLVDDKLGIPEPDRLPFRKMYLPKPDDEQDDAITDRLYPTRVKPGAPSPVELDKLSGSYHDPGYGTMTFTAQKDTGELVAERPDLWSQYRLTLRHVSAEFWVVRVKQTGSAGGLAMDLPAKFEVGIDGQVKALTIDYGGNGTVNFIRK